MSALFHPECLVVVCLSVVRGTAPPVSRCFLSMLSTAEPRGATPPAIAQLLLLLMLLVARRQSVRQQSISSPSVAVNCAGCLEYTRYREISVGFYYGRSLEVI